MARTASVAALLAGLALASYFVYSTFLTPEPYPAPDVVSIPAGQQSYRLSGQYAVGTSEVDAPLEVLVHDSPLLIMKYHVRQEDYANCVADEICISTNRKDGSNLPQTYVSFHDAQRYAVWLSDRTGQNWRLPTDAEWARAAGDKFYDDALGIGTETNDPSDRWIAAYQARIEQRSPVDPELHPSGSYGENEFGVADLSENVWEWTTDCFKNASLAEDETTVTVSRENCGVRVAEGQHRAYVVDFVRDARSGGCGVGIPPDFLGFRLVRETS